MPVTEQADTLPHHSSGIREASQKNNKKVALQQADGKVGLEKAGS